MSILDSVKAEMSTVFNWFNHSSIGQQIEADFKSAVGELEQIAAADLEAAVKEIGLASLAGLATGGTSGAISAGIASAVEQFKKLEADVSTKTINTLVSTVVNQVSTAASQP